MENPIIIIGAEEFGQIASDICQENQVEIYCFLDEQKELHNKEINNIPVMGSPENEDLLNMLKDRCDCFVAASNAKYRKTLSDKILEKYKKKPINVIHTLSSISQFASLGHGNLLESGSVLKAESAIGDVCYIGANTVIDFGTKIGDHAHIGNNCVIGKNVTLEDDIFIGNGATIVDGITIEKGASIGAGSVVISNVSKGQQIFGNPGKPYHS